jgi:hypothetical protein
MMREIVNPVHVEHSEGAWPIRCHLLVGEHRATLYALEDWWDEDDSGYDMEEADKIFGR